MLQFNLNYLEVSDASFVKLREALEGFPRHSVDRLALYVHVLLASNQVLMELVDFVEAGNLSLFIVDNIFLLFLNIVHRSLNLGCQILLQNLKVILLLLILHPMHRLLLFLEDAHFLGGQFRFGAASKQEGQVLRVDGALSLITNHTRRN